MPLIIQAKRVCRSCRKFDGVNLTNDVIAMAAQYLKGAPFHYYDFMANRAIASGIDVGAVSSVPNLTGTLNLSSAGHTVASSANVLVISSLTINAPFTTFVEFVRVSDTGLAETMIQIDAGVNNDASRTLINPADLIRMQEVVAGSTTFDTATGITAALSTTYKGSTRYATNNNIAAIGGSLKALNNTVSIPAGKTTIRFGGGVAGSSLASAVIRRAAVFSTGLEDALLTYQSA